MLHIYLGISGDFLAKTGKFFCSRRREPYFGIPWFPFPVRLRPTLRKRFKNRHFCCYLILYSCISDANEKWCKISNLLAQIYCFIGYLEKNIENFFCYPLAEISNYSRPLQDHTWAMAQLDGEELIKLKAWDSKSDWPKPVNRMYRMCLCSPLSDCHFFLQIIRTRELNPLSV